MLAKLTYIWVIYQHQANINLVMGYKMGFCILLYFIRHDTISRWFFAIVAVILIIGYCLTWMFRICCCRFVWPGNTKDVNWIRKIEGIVALIGICNLEIGWKLGIFSKDDIRLRYIGLYVIGIYGQNVANLFILLQQILK